MYDMLHGRGNAERLNVFCSDISRIDGSTGNNSNLCGASISWTTMTNGKYNSSYNIYLYNNYTG
jgi:hypothetical protein